MTMAHEMGKIMVICLMVFGSTTCSALGDSRSISDGLKSHLSDRDDNKLAIKKAYTYVSEYKRLPVFNFGIGKRWNDGGNGIKSAQPYSFGFGKRANSKNSYPMRMGLDYAPYENYDDYTKDRTLIETRSEGAKRGGRIRQYDFGLGKRNAVSSFDSSNVFADRENIDESKRRLNDNIERRFLYGSSNAYDDDRDNIPQED